MGVLPSAWCGAQLCRQQCLVSVLWLVFTGLQCALGDRNGDDGDSLAVDTGAHFHRSGVLEIEQPHAEVGHMDAMRPSVADGIFDKLESVSKVLNATSAMEKSAGTSAHFASEEFNQEASTSALHFPSTQRELARFFDDSWGMEKPPSMLQSWSNEKQGPDVPKILIPEALKHHSGGLDRSSRKLLELKEPVAQDLVKAKTVMAKQELKHHRRGLDRVAGQLLQLEEAVVRDQMRRTGRANPPSFDSLDQSHAGSISVDAFKEFLSSSVSDPDGLMKKLDVDSSGKIDRQEYDKAVKDNMIKCEDLKPELCGKEDSAAFRRCRSSVVVPLVSLVFFWKLL